MSWFFGQSRYMINPLFPSRYLCMSLHERLLCLVLDPPSSSPPLPSPPPIHARKSEERKRSERPSAFCKRLYTSKHIRLFFHERRRGRCSVSYTVLSPILLQILLTPQTSLVESRRIKRRVTSKYSQHIIALCKLFFLVCLVSPSLSLSLAYR